MGTSGSGSGRAPAAPAAAGDGLSSARLSAAPPLELSSGAVFRREGEYWTIAYDGVVFRLRDTKGLHCVAYLLRHPGVTVAATDLLGATDGANPGTAALLTPGPLIRNHRTLVRDREHVRILIAKRIKAAVQKIGAQHPALGYHLGTAIKTGYYCVYRPDPAHPIIWTQ